MSLRNFFSNQARRPSGMFGRFFMTRIFNKGNRALNDRMVELVDAKGNDRILEIGFGPGSAIHKMADTLESGLVEGIDFSDSMIGVAKKKNKQHITAGKVKLAYGNFDETAYIPEKFDTICSTNTMYFWPDPRATFAKIRTTLKPGGAVVLGFVDKCKMKDMPLAQDVFSLYSLDDIQTLLQQSGFTAFEAHFVGEKESARYCVKALKA